MADLEHDVADPPGHDLRGRVGLEAVHGRGDAAAGAGRKAVARRSGAQVHSRAARLRRAADDPAHADAYERAARLGQRRLDRRVAADGTRVHTHAHVLDIVSRQRVAELSVRAPAIPTAIPATTWPRSSSRA